MKKLALSLALVALFAPQAFADQLQRLESEADAIDAAARIQPGMPYVNWISHMGDSAPRLLVAKSAEVRKVPGEPYWEVIVDATPVGERRGGKWASLDAGAESRAIDLAYVYVPERRQSDGQRFRNLSKAMGLEAMVEREAIVVPTGPMNAAVKASDSAQKAQAHQATQNNPTGDWADEWAAGWADDGQGEAPAEGEQWDDWLSRMCRWKPLPLVWSDDHWEDFEATVNEPLSAEDEAYWATFGDTSIDIVGDLLSELLAGWVNAVTTEDQLLEAGPQSVGALGALDALKDEPQQQRSGERRETRPSDLQPVPQVDATPQQTRKVQGVVDRPLGD